MDSLVDALGPGALFVAVVESGSTDATRPTLRAFGRHLTSRGVPHRLSLGRDLVLPVFREGGEGHRIDYLARLRNAALGPLLALARGSLLPTSLRSSHGGEDTRAATDDRDGGDVDGYAAVPGPAHFDRVLFVNDVLLCGGDLLKLLASPADLACGYDFQGHAFWDSWVYEPGPAGFPRCLDINDGAPPLNSGGGSHGGGTGLPTLSPPLVDVARRRLNATEAALARARGDGARPAPCASGEAPQPVKCCWNGGVAISAEAVYAGIRFRRGWSAEEGDPAECDQSECTLLCRDMKRLGFDRIEADPTVQARVACRVESRERKAGPGAGPESHFECAHLGHNDSDTR